MKDIVKYFATAFVFGAGYMAGVWAWEEVLEDKVEDFRGYLAKKKSEKKWS